MIYAIVGLGLIFALMAFGFIRLDREADQFRATTNDRLSGVVENVHANRKALASLNEELPDIVTLDRIASRSADRLDHLEDVVAGLAGQIVALGQKPHPAPIDIESSPESFTVTAALHSQD